MRFHELHFGGEDRPSFGERILAFVQGKIEGRAVRHFVSAQKHAWQAKKWEAVAKWMAMRPRVLELRDNRPVLIEINEFCRSLGLDVDDSDLPRLH